MKEGRMDSKGTQKVLKWFLDQEENQSNAAAASRGLYISNNYKIISLFYVFMHTMLEQQLVSGENLH